MEVEKLPTECGLAPCEDSKCPAASLLLSCPCLCRREGPVPKQTKDADPEDSTRDEGDLLYSKVQVGTRRELVNDLSVQFEDNSIYKIATGKHTPRNGPFDILIIGDPIHKPAAMAVIPEVQTLEPGEEIFISVMCLDYPYFLPAGVPLAQAFLLPRDFPRTVLSNRTVFWVQLMGANKPIIKCALFSKGEKNQMVRDAVHGNQCHTDC